MMTFVKWSGSKRSQSKTIKEEINKVSFDKYFEPFIGSGAVLGELSPKKAVIGDNYEPLVRLWQLIQSSPALVSQTYKNHWDTLQSEGYLYFYKVRDHFNTTKDPLDLLFLSRTCVNGLIRFNKDGDFNNSLHHSRKGMHPDKLEKIIHEWSVLVKDYEIIYNDYRVSTKQAGKNDLVYLDPPYFNNKNRYHAGIDHEEFFKYLEDLNKRGVRFVLSYDGHSDTKIYSHEIPKLLYKRKVIVKSGLSAFKKTQTKTQDMVYESLYLNY